MSSSASSSAETEMVVKNRLLGFLIWQSIPSTAIFFFFKIFIHAQLSQSSSSSSASKTIFIALLSLITFQLSQLFFSVALSNVSSPQPHRPSSPLQLASGLVRLLLVSGECATDDFRRRAKLSLSFVLFVATAAVSGFVSVLSLCWGNDVDTARVGYRGFAVGLLFGLFYIWKRRWVLEFPIIQRAPFFSFKMGLPLATARALKLSVAAYLFSALLVIIVPDQCTTQVTMGKFVAEQIIFYVGSFVLFLCWELSHHLHRVLHTKRFKFAPPKGSAAAETNPSEPLLAALEDSIPGSLLQYLAYLDLCMVCENNVDTWRRAAFFEETSETYKRVTTVCLRPLEKLASKLSEGLKGSLLDKSSQLSNQLQSPSVSQVDSKYSEPLNNLQLYVWCARSAASLTAKSHKEDRFGVAQLSNSNAAVISTLISCLLAVEAFMGKKTSLRSSHNLMGPSGIKWAALSPGRRDVTVSKKRGGPLDLKAYAMADVVRTSIYCMVSEFHSEMLASAKAGLLEKDWIISTKPPFGTRELLVQKLQLFLDFQAS